MIILSCFMAASGMNYAYAEDNNLYIKVQADYDRAYDVLDRVNRERSKRGLSELPMDQTIMDAAYVRATETILYFEHARPNGEAWHSVDSKVDGENLGMGTGSASEIMRLWMESPGHKENIVRSEFACMGVACIEYGDTYYWVQLFSRSGSDGAERPQNATESLPIDLPDSEEGGEFALDYSITMNGKEESEIEADSGDRYDLGLRAYDINFDPAKIKWSTDDPEIARIDEKGMLSIEDKGRMEIEASSGSIKRASVKIDSRDDLKDLFIMNKFSHKTELNTVSPIDGEDPVPELIILGDEGPLVKDLDYTLRCTDPDEDGDAIAEIHGTGRYKGIVNMEYKVQIP